MTEPWYKDGLRFECNNCGDCCAQWKGYVWLTDDDIARLAAHFRLPVSEVTAKYTENSGTKHRTLLKKAVGGCFFYNHSHGCTIQDAKPNQCSSYPFFRRTLESEDIWQADVRHCPGAEQGAIIPAEEITARISQSKVL